MLSAAASFSSANLQARIEPPFQRASLVACGLSARAVACQSRQAPTTPLWRTPAHPLSRVLADFSLLAGAGRGPGESGVGRRRPRAAAKDSWRKFSLKIPCQQGRRLWVALRPGLLACESSACGHGPAQPEPAAGPRSVRRAEKEPADQHTAVSPAGTARPRATVERGSRPRADWAGLCAPRPVTYRDTGPTAAAGEWPGMAGPGRGRGCSLGAVAVAP